MQHTISDTHLILQMIINQMNPNAWYKDLHTRGHSLLPLVPQGEGKKIFGTCRGLERNCILLYIFNKET